MKEQIIKMKAASGTSKKTGNPYSGYFVSMLYIDNNGELECEKSFVNATACQSVLPADTMVEVVTGFPTGRIEQLKPLPNEQPLVVR